MRELLEIEEMMHVDEHSAHFLSYHVFWKDCGTVYHAHYPHNDRDAAIKAALGNLLGQLVPEADVYGQWREGLTEAPPSLLATSFIKCPLFMGYNGNDSISRSASAEVEALELFSKYPHPNICEYRGCIRQGSFIVGICLRKYECDLQSAVKDPARIPNLDHEHILAGVLSGIEHIHSLELVHNDINPRNIMLDQEGHPYIIDFDTCLKKGERFGGGTLGWSKFPEISLPENDLYGVRVLRMYLEGKYDGMDPPPDV